MASTLRSTSRFQDIALVVALIVARALGSVVLPLYDDAFITFRFARNLAFGHGLVYHPGEWVFGITCPLFGVLCALPYTLGVPMPATIQVCNVLCDVAVLLLTLAALRRESGETEALVFAGLFATSPILTRVCIGGMEMNLYLATSLGAIACFLRGNRWVSVVLASLCCLLRPEGVLLLGIVLLATGLTRGVRASLRGGLLAAAVLAPAFGWLWMLYGSPLPQSVMAKARLVRVQPNSPLQMPTQLFGPDALMIACLPLAAWGIVVAARDRTRAFHRMVGAWALAYVGFYAVTRAYVHSWYGEPVYYTLLVTSALGAHDLLARLAAAPHARMVRVLRAAMLVPVLAWGALLAKQGRSGVTRGIFEGLQRWSRTHAAASASYMAVDIGALGYYTNGRIYDQAGLVWPEAATFHAPEEIIEKYRPRYLYMNVGGGARRFMESPRYGKLYRPIARFSNTGATGFDLRQAPAGVWLQDYVLFERTSEADSAAGTRQTP